MKGLVFALCMLLLCGCSFIIAKDQDISTYGIKREDASTLTQEIKRQRPEGLSGADFFPEANLK